MAQFPNFVNTLPKNSLSIRLVSSFPSAAVLQREAEYTELLPGRQLFLDLVSRQQVTILGRMGV